MTNFLRRTKHPKTGQMEEAEWIDDYYGRHVYGVRFPGSDVVYHQWAHEWEHDDEPIEIPDPKPEARKDDK